MSWYKRISYIFSTEKPWRGRVIRTIRTSGTGLKRVVDLRWQEAWLTTFTSWLLRIGALLLLAGLIIILWRMLNYTGYTIQQFNVPKNLVDSGFDGTVIARRLEDQYAYIKSIAVSVKEDSIQAVGDEQQPELNVDVLGVGVSLRSIGFHLRDLFGRKNNLIRGELTMADDTLALTLRMSGVKAETVLEPLAHGMRPALDALLSRAAELILKNTDPYRLAIYYNHRKAYDQGIEIVKLMLTARPAEDYWAYLAWGALLEGRQDMHGALQRYDQSLKANPDFPLAWVRKGTILAKLNRADEAVRCLEDAVRLKPDEPAYWNTYANLLDMTGKPDESDQAFRKVQELMPNEKSWLFNWAERLVGRGKIDDAKLLLDEIIAESEQKNNTANLAYAKFFGAVLDNDSSRIDEAARMVLDADLNNPYINQMVVRAYYQTGNYEAAISSGRIVRNMDLVDQQKQVVLNLLAMCYNFTGRPDSALVYIHEAIALDSTAGYPYSTLAETWHYQGNTKRFYYFLEKAFAKGMLPNMLQPTEPPYNLYWDKPAFQDLVRKYSPAPQKN